MKRLVYLLPFILVNVQPIFLFFDGFFTCSFFWGVLVCLFVVCLFVVVVYREGGLFCFTMYSVSSVSYLRSFYPPRIVVVRVIAVAVVLTGISFSPE